MATFPPLIARWIDALDLGPIPTEQASTCDTCAMCPTSAGGSAPEPADPQSLLPVFQPATKCCTYYPVLANFLLGKILADESQTAGREVVLARLAGRERIDPLGMRVTHAHRRLHRENPHRFGRSPELQCPFTTPQASCGIWQHRCSACATWFCKHDRGAAGLRFYNALHRYLRSVEKNLAMWCLLELGVDDGVLGHCTQIARPDEEHDPDEEPELAVRDALYRAAWGPLAGQEVGFYERCAELVEALPAEQVVELCGPRTRAAERLLRARYRDLQQPVLPARLRQGRRHVEARGDGRVALFSYSNNNPLEVPADLLPLLDFFDGRPVALALHEMEVATDTALGPKLIQRLVDFDVLIDGQ